MPLRFDSAILPILLFAGAASAAQDAFLHPERLRIGGHGGPWARLTTLDGNTAVSGGGVFGLSTNPGFSWIATANYLEADADGLDFGYGGLGWETSFRYRKVVQPMAQFQIGYGRAAKEGKSSPAWIGEAMGMVGFRVGYGEKIILGAGYREVEGLRGIPGIGDSELDGWNASLRLDYGIYDASAHPRPPPPSGGPVFSGFYSGKWTRLDGRGAWLDGGGTTAIFRKRWAVGIGGYRSRGEIRNGSGTLSLGYGGLLARGYIRPEERLHGSLTLLAAMGGVGVAPPGEEKPAVRATPVLDSDLAMEFNLTAFLRVAVAAGYRWAPVHLRGLGPGDWGGPTACVQWATGAF